MRRAGVFSIVALFLFLAGCGGGGMQTAASPGGSTDTTVSTGGDPVIPAGYGVIRLNFSQGDRAAPADVRSLAPINSLPAADNVRIAARLITTENVTLTDEEGNDYTITVTHETYRKIVDVSLPVSSISIAVPADNNYIVEILSSKLAVDNTNTVYHTMLRYGKATGVNVLAGAGTENPVTITPQPIANYLTIGMPVNVVAGNQYSIPVSFDNVPLRRPYLFAQYIDNVANSAPPWDLFVNGVNSPSFTSTVTFTSLSLTTSPSTAVYWDLYAQGLFYIDDSWKNTSDSVNWWKQWRFYYPNPTAGFGDALLKTRLFPLGTVDIGVIGQL